MKFIIIFAIIAVSLVSAKKMLLPFDTLIQTKSFPANGADDGPEFPTDEGSSTFILNYCSKGTTEKAYQEFYGVENRVGSNIVARVGNWYIQKDVSSKDIYETKMSSTEILEDETYSQSFTEALKNSLESCTSNEVKHKYYTTDVSWIKEHGCLFNWIDAMTAEDIATPSATGQTYTSSDGTEYTGLDRYETSKGFILFNGDIPVLARTNEDEFTAFREYKVIEGVDIMSESIIANPCSPDSTAAFVSIGAAGALVIGGASYYGGSKSGTGSKRPAKRTHKLPKASEEDIESASLSKSTNNEKRRSSGSSKRSKKSSGSSKK